nr:ATP-dependent RNA helicase DDX51-like isoform X3 [Saimiri boliviensis boliviensis]
MASAEGQGTPPSSGEQRESGTRGTVAELFRDTGVSRSRTTRTALTTQHTAARGCADTRGHRKRRSRRAGTRGPTAGTRPPRRAHPARSPRRQHRPVPERRGPHAPLEVRTTLTPADRTPEPQVQPPPQLPGLGRA